MWNSLFLAEMFRDVEKSVVFLQLPVLIKYFNPLNPELNPIC
jgi:hypothetical protein